MPAAAAPAGAACTYHLGDLRTTDYGDGYDLAMILYGEVNVFAPHDIATILGKAHAALKPGGRLLLEPHTFAFFEALPPHATDWFSSRQAAIWRCAASLPDARTIGTPTPRSSPGGYYVIDAATADVTRYAQSLQAYQEDDYRELLTRHGFGAIDILPGLAPDRLDPSPGLCALLATKA